MCGTFFLFWLGFWKNSDSVQNKFGLVRFEKMQFGSDIIVTYYLCNSKVVNLQPILQSYCNV